MSHSEKCCVTSLGLKMLSHDANTVKKHLSWYTYLNILFILFSLDKKKSAGSCSSSGGSRNLWVSGLSTSTRATDLKHHFSKFGKVYITPAMFL